MVKKRWTLERRQHASLLSFGVKLGVAPAAVNPDPAGFRPPTLSNPVVDLDYETDPRTWLNDVLDEAEFDEWLGEDSAIHDQTYM
ncbi:hypothetical protein CYMTET_49341 [Cymbomonas tetramitiformis]|uniref:Uncharacterized protein n=1 Tax=Cymbomonas tetramitiformis TaxID=36881 RepID=A0AAE0EVW2_9CHLO|nr:hypothetical protein CYMTET_49341 [Cymbomonas tetramitiformis]